MSRGWVSLAELLERYEARATEELASRRRDAGYRCPRCGAEFASEHGVRAHLRRTRSACGEGGR